MPHNISLVVLPPYSPELNPVERVWLFLRKRFLSLRVLDDTEAIIDTCCAAWLALIAEPGRLKRAVTLSINLSSVQRRAQPG